MVLDTDSILPLSTQKQPISTSKCSLTLEERNSNAAVKVYRKRLEKNEIRLIKIHHGEKPSEIQCSSFTVRNAGLPDYEALSYVCKYSYIRLGTIDNKT